jgi:hypothetical protein
VLEVRVEQPYTADSKDIGRWDPVELLSGQRQSLDAALPGVDACGQHAGRAEDLPAPPVLEQVGRSVYRGSDERSIA